VRNHVVAGVSVTFYVANEKKPDSPSMHVIGTAGAGIAHADLVALCEAVCRRVQGKLPISQKRSLYDFVKPLLLFLQTPKVRWPGSSSEWQLFLLNFLRFYLLNREFSGASVGPQNPAGGGGHWSQPLHHFSQAGKHCGLVGAAGSEPVKARSHPQ
jgi:hypothetical protein